MACFTAPWQVDPYRRLMQPLRRENVVAEIEPRMPALSDPSEPESTFAAFVGMGLATLLGLISWAALFALWRWVF